MLFIVAERRDGRGWTRDSSDGDDDDEQGGGNLTKRNVGDFCNGTTLSNVGLLETRRIVDAYGHVHVDLIFYVTSAVYTCELETSMVRNTHRTHRTQRR